MSWRRVEIRAIVSVLYEDVDLATSMHLEEAEEAVEMVCLPLPPLS